MKRSLAMLGLAVLAFAGYSAADDVSVNWKSSDRRTSCSDLSVKFDDAEAIRAEQEVPVPAPGAPLEVTAAENGGIHVSGWNQNTYKVVACKAAANKAMLDQIQVNSGDKITATGPHDRNWTVFFIVYAPKASVLSLNAHNGPVSLWDLTGKATVRAVNGPIDVKEFGGDLDAQTQNGPISFKGAHGNVKLRTENGPLKLDLEENQWTGGELVASAQNGPVRVSVPPEFASPLVAEGKHGPMRCSGSICDKSTQKREDGVRRIELNAGSPVVRAQTVNGPVTVESGKFKM